tara:strand:+ start:422 stop:862 length:441 start_codon:yes stop_codon:yes gene_type:complete
VTTHHVELFIKGTYLSIIECDDGSFYEEDCSEFTEIKLPDTENLDTEALTLFVQKNLKVLWDGELDNPDHFCSYKVKKIDGPTGVFYSEDGMSMRDISIILKIETNENINNLDFDDFFHLIVLELTSKDIKFIFTRYDEYSSQLYL